MSLKEKLDLVVELMTDTKEKWVESEPDDTDLAIYLHFWRADDLVATVQCPMDRDTALTAGNMAAAGFGADTMAITFESYHTELPTSPLTGKRWRPREMQYVVETVPDQDWVQECVTTTIHERGGSFAVSSHSYRIVDGKLEWLDEVTVMEEDESEVTPDGYMFSYLQEAMSHPKIEQIVEEQAAQDEDAALINNLVNDPERRLFHIDMATWRALTDRDLITSLVLAAEKGSNREQWLTERLGPPNYQA